MGNSRDYKPYIYIIYLASDSYTVNICHNSCLVHLARQFPVDYCTCTVKVHGVRLQCPGKDEHESQRLTSPLQAAHPQRNMW